MSNQETFIPMNTLPITEQPIANNVESWRLFVRGSGAPEIEDTAGGTEEIYLICGTCLNYNSKNGICTTFGHSCGPYSKPVTNSCHSLS